MDKEDLVRVCIMCVCVCVCMHMCEYTYTYIKKEWNDAICNNMDGSGDYHTKWSKWDRDKYHMISLTCGI